MGGDGEWELRAGMEGDHGDGGLETASIGEAVCVGGCERRDCVSLIETHVGERRWRNWWYQGMATFIVPCIGLGWDKLLWLL